MLMTDGYYLQRAYTYYDNYVYPEYQEVGRVSVSYFSVGIFPALRYPGKSITPFAYIGPRMEFLISHNQDPYFGYNTVVGVSAGLGAEKSISKSANITAEFRTSINSLRSFNNSFFAGDSNYSFDFLLGINFEISNTIGE